jgi:hypothetical protein
MAVLRNLRYVQNLAEPEKLRPELSKAIDTSNVDIAEAGAACVKSVVDTIVAFSAHLVADSAETAAFDAAMRGIKAANTFYKGAKRAGDGLRDNSTDLAAKIVDLQPFAAKLECAARKNAERSCAFVKEPSEANTADFKTATAELSTAAADFVKKIDTYSAAQAVAAAAAERAPTTATTELAAESVSATATAAAAVGAGAAATTTTELASGAASGAAAPAPAGAAANEEMERENEYDYALDTTTATHGIAAFDVALGAEHAPTPAGAAGAVAAAAATTELVDAGAVDASEAPEAEEGKSSGEEEDSEEDSDQANEAAATASIASESEEEGEGDGDEVEYEEESEAESEEGG